MANNEEQNFAELYENSLKRLEEGTVVEGTIVDIVDEDIFVDLGYKADGVIPRGEFSYGDEKPQDKLKVGQKVSAYILKMNNGQGNILLSMKRLQNKKLKEEFEANVKENKPIEVKVTETMDAGVVGETGSTKVFIPRTQLAKKGVTDLTEYKGKTLAIKVIEYNPEKRKIIGSERKLADELRQIRLAQTWAEIEVGKKVMGTVRQIMDYGAFVDIGGVDGLLHVSEISWKQIKTPADVLKVGDQVPVTIIKLDKENNKISLSMKNPEDDPWAKLPYELNDTVTGKVVSLKPFGAFVELPNGVEALVHISNITNKRIAKPDEVLSIGDEVTGKVTVITPEKRRIEISMREMDVPAEGTENVPVEGEETTTTTTETTAE